MQQLLDAIKRARRVYLIGNGGSAANAIHIANDLVSVGIKAHALTADVATLTAIANDFGYENVFSRQIEVFCEKDDLLIALSGSGTSPNIIKAIYAARDIGMDTFAVKGMFGPAGSMAISHSSICFGTTMQEAEEYQLKLGHSIMLALKGAQ